MTLLDSQSAFFSTPTLTRNGLNDRSSSFSSCRQGLVEVGRLALFSNETALYHPSPDQANAKTGRGPRLALRTLESTSTAAFLSQSRPPKNYGAAGFALAYNATLFHCSFIRLNPIGARPSLTFKSSRVCLRGSASVRESIHNTQSRS
jgi:hypothetical protein